MMIDDKHVLVAQRSVVMRMRVLHRAFPTFVAVRMMAVVFVPMRVVNGWVPMFDDG